LSEIAILVEADSPTAIATTDSRNLTPLLAVRAVGLSELALRGSIYRENVEMQRKEDCRHAEVESGEQHNPFAVGIFAEEFRQRKLDCPAC
jgi:hypothetical protein